MTNPTSNFGWQMPTATDLVTDLPADFEVFGQAVDTDFVDLLGGTTGQILSKTSNTDLDFTWITNDVGDITNIAVTSPITGGGSSGSVTIGVSAATTSASGVVQLSDSTSTTSSVLASTSTATKSAYDLAAAAVPKSTVTTAGDVIYATGSSAVTRLGIGTANQVLAVNAGATAPEWKTISTTPTAVACYAYKQATQSIPNATWTLLNWDAEWFDTDSIHDNATNNSRFYAPTGKSGYYFIHAYAGLAGSATGLRQLWIRKNNASDYAIPRIDPSGGVWNLNTSGIIQMTAGDFLTVSIYQTSGGALDVQGNALGNPYSVLSFMYLGA